MFLIALSGIFRYGIVSDRIPKHISIMVLGIADTPDVVTIWIVLFLFLVGRFVGGSVRIIMLTPILPPLATALGFGPVRVGLAVIIAITTGNVTPPAGSVTCPVCSILACSRKRPPAKLDPAAGRCVADGSPSARFSRRRPIHDGPDSWKGLRQGTMWAVPPDWLDSVESKAVSLRLFNRMGAGCARVRKRYLKKQEVCHGT